MNLTEPLTLTFESTGIQTYTCHIPHVPTRTWHWHSMMMGRDIKWTEMFLAWSTSIKRMPLDFIYVWCLLICWHCTEMMLQDQCKVQLAKMYIIMAPVKEHGLALLQLLQAPCAVYFSRWSMCIYCSRKWRCVHCDGAPCAPLDNIHFYRQNCYPTSQLSCQCQLALLTLIANWNNIHLICLKVTSRLVNLSTLISCKAEDTSNQQP